METQENNDLPQIIQLEQSDTRGQTQIDSRADVL